MTPIAPRRLLDRPSRALRRFRDEEPGLAAVEFALIMPLLIAVWVAVATACQVERSATAVNNATSTLADMVAQEGGGDVWTLMEAIGSTLRQEDADKLYLKVTKVVVPSQSQGGNPKVVWWYDNKGRSGGGGADFDLPAALKIKGPSARHLMIADGELMGFEPFFGSFLPFPGKASMTGDFDIKHRAIFSPRNSQ